MEKLKPYIVEFYDNGAIKLLVYLSDWEMRSKNCQPIIVITFDEYTFSIND